MDFNQVKELISIINQSSLTEFELQLDSDSVKMSKNPEAKAVSDPVAVTKELKQEVVIQPAAESVKENKEDIIITSPIVGTYYNSQSPESPAFVKVGDRVKAGTVLCIVEAMKIMNEITAKSDGVIAEIMVTNEQMVEYNQPLIKII